MENHHSMWNNSVHFSKNVSKEKKEDLGSVISHWLCEHYQKRDSFFLLLFRKLCQVKLKKKSKSHQDSFKILYKAVLQELSITAKCFLSMFPWISETCWKLPCSSIHGPALSGDSTCAHPRCRAWFLADARTHVPHECYLSAYRNRQGLVENNNELTDGQGSCTELGFHPSGARQKPGFVLTTCSQVIGNTSATRDVVNWSMTHFYS